MQTGSLFVKANTSIHRLHPVVKVLGLLFLFVPAMAFNLPLWEAVILALALLLLLVAGGAPNLQRLGAFLVVLFLMASLMWSLFLLDVDEPQVLAQLGPLTISEQSVLYGVAMGCRITALLVFGLVFVTTTRPEDFTFALRRLGLPGGMSVALSLSFRLLPSFLATVQTVKDAQRARGLDLSSGGLLTRLRRYLSLAAPVFGYALRQADNLSRALEARGLMARAARVELRTFTVRWYDVAAMVMVVCAATISVWLRLSGYGELLPRL
jgi:energy-coupling factor transport system permease protein